MEILIVILAIIVVFYRRNKGTILKSVRKVTVRLAALILSLILVISLLITELTQRLLDWISKEEQKTKTGGSTCSLERKTKM
jgi:hypothetical protein